MWNQLITPNEGMCWFLSEPVGPSGKPDLNSPEIPFPLYSHPRLLSISFGGPPPRLMSLSPMAVGRLGSTPTRSRPSRADPGRATVGGGCCRRRRPGTGGAIGRGGRLRGFCRERRPPAAEEARGEACYNREEATRRGD